MEFRIFTLLSLSIIFVFHSLATALPAAHHVEAKDLSDENSVSVFAIGASTFSTPPTFESLCPIEESCTMATISGVNSWSNVGTTTNLLTVVTPEAWNLSTFSEISPIWSSGSPLTLSSLAAGSGFTARITPSSTPTSTIATPATPAFTGVNLTSTTSTVFVYPSKTTAGAVAYSTSISRAVATTLVAGLGSLLGVALGAVALL
ncbi:uncharacterized protein K444DRAFT_636734 [Hyaloscypha bicolor E]|uniref:GPI anchored protein n=1 Tax=Hyaloscypha bicolor E TaxID=1095630 RepID=A0A2J6SKZ5_9HELO|nr:uncharacterized protein K444DRAFT_636734 [Hyaloscypha bicolor E]PMD51435.1 hypothetical protein K444DRAFT_636734 [Hyaloscypha bicolor E]